MALTALSLCAFPATAVAQTFTFNPVADTYMRSDMPASTFGTATTLRVDNDPIDYAYIRFDVRGLQGPVTKATLRLLSSTSATANGVDLRAIADNTWGETTLNFNNAPGVGATVVFNTGAFNAGQWVSFDATPLVSANGLVSMTLTTRSTASRSFHSREDTVNPPQLIVEAADNIAPDITLATPADAAVTGTATPTFAGTAGTAAADSNTVTAKVYAGTTATGLPVQTLTATRSGGAWSVSGLQPLTDGVYTAQAEQSDAAGNVGQSAAHSFTIDTTSPTVVLTSPADGTSTNTTTPAFSGLAGTAPGDSGTVRVKVYAGGSPSGTPAQTVTSAATGGTWSAAAPAPLAEGTYTAQGEQSDGAGNVGVSAPHTFTIDATAPTVTVTLPPADSSTKDTTPTFAGAAGTAPGDSAGITVKVYAGLSANGAPVETLTTSRASGAWSVDALPALANGTYTVQAEQADGASNLGRSQPVTFTVDTNAPPLVALTAPADGSSVNTATPLFRGTGGTASGDSTTVGVKVYPGTSATGTPVETVAGTVAGDGSWSVAASPALAEGTYTAQAQQSDNAGHVGLSRAATFTVDLTPPDTVLDSQPPDPSDSAGATFTFHATEAGSTFECRLDAGSYAPCTSGRDYSGLSAGGHTFAVRAIDRAGNTDPTPAAASWTVDTSVPAVTLTAPPDGSSSTETTPTTFGGAAGTASGDSNTVTVKIYGGSTVSGDPVRTLAATQSAGSWSVTASPALAEGGYTAQAEQRDAVGNVGRSAARTFAVTAPVIAAAGDIACDPLNTKFNAGLGTSTSCRQRYTSDLLVGQGLTAVMLLGDAQYECSGYNAYLQSYDLSWGRVKALTHPVVGNHEYDTSGGTDCDTTGMAGGFFRYFGTAGGDPSAGYYSYDVGSWHIVALNSNDGCRVISCGTGSLQENWLKADLAAHPAACTLAYWHAPRFSSGSTTRSYLPIWRDLYAAGADVVVNGHVHNYERFAPQDPDGNLDTANGIRQFVAGTGGASHGSFSTILTNSQVRDSATYGVLKLTLHASSYDWQFVPEAGKTFIDSGSTACH